MTEPKIKNIHERILDVMEDIAYIKKGDKTVNDQYTFVGHDAVTAALHPVLVKHGIVCLPSITEHRQDGNRTEASITLTLVNVDDPSDKVEINGFGYGIDKQDKGPGKAMSYAVKMLLLKTFMLETGERDNEADLVDHVDDYAIKVAETIKQHQDTCNAIRDGIAEGDLGVAIEAWDELTDDEKIDLWVAPSKGGFFTTEERKIMKSPEWLAARVVEAA